MSYILDALRKSDQQRRRGAAPTLLLGPVAEAAPKRPALLSYGLGALLLLAVGIAIGWLRPWQGEPIKPAPATPASAPAVAAQAPAAQANPSPAARPELPAQQAALAPSPPPAQVQPPAVAPAPASASASTGASVATSASAQANTGAQLQGVEAPPRVIARTPQSAAPAKHATAVAAQPAPVNMADLPLAIQQELPAMSISVHAYSSDPAERLVGVNNRLLHEGDEVAPGLKLEQITPEGMILSYKGYRFFRGVH